MKRYNRWEVERAGSFRHESRISRSLCSPQKLLGGGASSESSAHLRARSLACRSLEIPAGGAGAAAPACLLDRKRKLQQTTHEWPFQAERVSRSCCSLVDVCQKMKIFPLLLGPAGFHRQKELRELQQRVLVLWVQDTDPLSDHMLVQRARGSFWCMKRTVVPRLNVS